MNNELVTLITITGCKQNAEGIASEVETFEVEVFANEKSVGRTEFYEALRSGYKAKMILEIDFDDFRLSEKEVQVNGGMKMIKATRARYQGTEYRILRTYRNNYGMLELTLSEVE